MISSESSLPSYNPKSPIQSEPTSTSLSTIKDSVYSPSSSDGAVLPAEGGDKPSDLKLKLSCSVVLVDVHALSKSKTKTEKGLKRSEHNFGSPLPKDLRRHQGVHTGHRLCCFTKCPNDIWRLQDIVAHSRDGYACDICGKTFKRRKILRRHARFHTGVKPYACSVCAKTFALRKSLRRHQRFHTGDRPHACLQCGKSFRLRDNLKAHLRFHTGEKPYSCALCGKKFRIMRNLSQHRENPCHVFVPSFRTIAAPGPAVF
uniref:C2H2-type domain-containing protein n=1 Tax=Gouania willdenowi TaxID=441366 RepID=A0A8C5NC63_GOUWI